MPHDPNTVADCKWWIDNDGSNKCEDIPDNWGIDMVDWLMWYAVNILGPPEGSGCGQYLPAARRSYQGLYYLPQGTRTRHLSRIIDEYRTFTLDEFHRWNPAVGSACHSLFVDYIVCVGAPGKSPRPLKNNGHSPTQPGIPKSCNKYYKADRGDTCQGIVD
ncbi:LysM domain-containing protein [Metarhizium anisopliae]|nr:LysM domain-containing protein [Metarhizium anisopliae]